jgi:hypothetical protein
MEKLSNAADALLSAVVYSYHFPIIGVPGKTEYHH